MRKRARPGWWGTDRRMKRNGKWWAVYILVVLGCVWPMEEGWESNGTEAGVVSLDRRCHSMAPVCFGHLSPELSGGSRRPTWHK